MHWWTLQIMLIVIMADHNLWTRLYAVLCSSESKNLRLSGLLFRAVRVGFVLKIIYMTDIMSNSDENSRSNITPSTVLIVGKISYNLGPTTSAQ